MKMSKDVADALGQWEAGGSPVITYIVTLTRKRKVEPDFEPCDEDFLREISS